MPTKPTAHASNLELLQQLVCELDEVKEKLGLIAEYNLKLLKSLEELPQKINGVDRRGVGGSFEFDVGSFSLLPVSLRKTVLALRKLEKATAEELAAETLRSLRKLSSVEPAFIRVWL